MRFTLIYDGQLPAQGSKSDGRVDLKHEIRKQFHKQLTELWTERPYLRRPLERWRAWPALRESWLQFGAAPDVSHWDFVEASRADIGDAARHARKISAGRPDRRLPSDTLRKLERAQEPGVVVPFKRGAFTFFPLATKRWGLVCDLDILFLRAEDPGALFPNTRGDLDNRLKVLFDALSMPEHKEQVPTGAPEPTEEPFFCLLQDDKLITSFRIDSERLLDEPQGSSRVQLVIRVTVKTRRLNLVTLELEGD